MNDDRLYMGVDIGTSGARVAIIDDADRVIAEGAQDLPVDPLARRQPCEWWHAVVTAASAALLKVDSARVDAISVDGTSGTMLPIDRNGAPLGHANMYNDAIVNPKIHERITGHAPAGSPTLGATSALARYMSLKSAVPNADIFHQADWIAGKFCGVYASDDNNALKTGYDSQLGRWPDWIDAVGVDINALPKVHRPGTVLAAVTTDIGNQLNLRPDVRIVSGTTDGCAAFLATGAEQLGDAISSLGTTLTVKILSDKPIFDSATGVYSHFLLEKWLVGGASNTGGNVLAHYFTKDEIKELTLKITPHIETGLDYYPLLSPGERFPVNDPIHPPKMSPRPIEQEIFYQAILEGIATIEARAYRKLNELGAPAIRTLRSLGGGSTNHAWTQIRERKLGVKIQPTAHSQAAFGAARLARHGAKA